jgi:hypothetical protein
VNQRVLSALEVATGTWPAGTRFRIEGHAQEWEEVQRTPTRVRLRRWQPVKPPATWRGEGDVLSITSTFRRAVKKYIAGDTPLRVLPSSPGA